MCVASLVLVGLALVLPGRPALQDVVEGKAAVGSLAPGFSFRALAGGDGRLELADFRGQPVLIVNWTHSDFGLGASGQLQKVAQELVPKGLVSILHDSHNKSAEDIEASVLQLYPGCRSWRAATHKLPILYADNGPPPDIALFGVDGMLLVAGSYASDFNSAVKAIKAEFKRTKKGWGEHKLARKARALAFGKLQLGAARAALASGLEREPGNAELMVVLDEVVHRHDTMKESVTYLIAQGECVRALEAAEAFEVAVRGHPAWEEEAAVMAEDFEGSELRAAVKLDEDLLSATKPWSKQKPKASHVARLRKLAASHEDEPVGRRATRLADIAQRMLDRQ